MLSHSIVNIENTQSPQNGYNFTHYLKAGAVFTVSTGAYWAAKTANLLPAWLSGA